MRTLKAYAHRWLIDRGRAAEMKPAEAELGRVLVRGRKPN